VIAGQGAEIEIAIFQSASERQCAEWRTIVKLQLSRSKNFNYALLNSEVTGPMFTKLLHDVEALLPLLKRYYILFRNARAKSEGSQFRRVQIAPELNWLP